MSGAAWQTPAIRVLKILPPAVSTSAPTAISPLFLHNKMLIKTSDPFTS